MQPIFFCCLNYSRETQFYRKITFQTGLNAHLRNEDFVCPHFEQIPSLGRFDRLRYIRHEVKLFRILEFGLHFVKKIRFVRLTTKRILFFDFVAAIFLDFRLDAKRFATPIVPRV